MRSTTITPSANRHMPSDLEKYCSKDVASLTSGESMLMIIVGDMIKGSAWVVNHLASSCQSELGKFIQIDTDPAVPYVYA